MLSSQPVVPRTAGLASPSRARARPDSLARQDARSADDVGPHYGMLIDELLAAHGVEPRAFERDIGAADRASWHALRRAHPGHRGLALWKYVESSLRLESVVGQIVRQALGGYHAIERLLVFGTGDARLARTLVHRVAPSQVWVADTDPDACAWQAAHFGVNALVAVADPERFALPLDFPAVFAASLPAGLDDAGFARWIARLYRCVGERGVLVFGASDARRESWVRQCVADIFPWRPLDVLRVPRGLPGEPDLYVVAGWGTSLRDLKVGVTPVGGFDAVTFDPRAGLLCSGWALDGAAGTALRSVRALLDEHWLYAGEIFGPAPGVPRPFAGAAGEPVRWRVSVPADAVAHGHAMRVELQGACDEAGHAMLSLIGGVDPLTDFTLRAT